MSGSSTPECYDDDCHNIPVAQVRFDGKWVDICKWCLSRYLQVEAANEEN